MRPWLLVVNVPWKLIISIHALTRSATCQIRGLCQRRSYFNPRTHKECDIKVSWLIRLTLNFNPRTHKECDFLMRVKGLPFAVFQSTHSQGVRLFVLIVFSVWMLFQSTHSQGVRQQCKAVIEWALCISIHALTRSATPDLYLLLPKVNYFNPRTHKECD